MIEKALERLSAKCRESFEIWNANKDDKYADGKNEGFIEALDIVQEVAKEYGTVSDNDLTVVSALPSLYPLQPFEEEAIHKVVASTKYGGWIPVNETPKTVDRYLCDIVVTQDECNARRIVIAKYDGQWRNAKGTEILAWQPLPALYQKECG